MTTYNSHNTKDLSLSIIIPAKNEKGNIKNIIKTTPNFGKQTELIFVEGHSNDGTLQEIKKIAKHYKNKNIKYFVQPSKGKADAVKLGFDKAQNEILIIWDADITVPSEELIKFYNVLNNNEADFVNGTRFSFPMEKDSMQKLNYFANKIFAKLFNLCFKQNLTDTLCGTKALFRKDYIKMINNNHLNKIQDPFGDFFLLFGAIKLNLKIKEIPVHYKARKYGKTNIFRFKNGWQLLQIFIKFLIKTKFKNGAKK